MQSATELTDGALVARCRAGDEAAWGLLVSRFSNYVYAICVRGFQLPDDDAQEVFQEVFARTYERLERLREDDAIKAWIGQLTRRLCIDRYRAGRRIGDDGVELDDRPDPAAAERLEQIDEALTVRAALGTLPEDCQSVLERFFCEDQSYHEISEALGIPSGTIASRISRCLARMRSILVDGAGRSRRAVAS